MNVALLRLTFILVAAFWAAGCAHSKPKPEYPPATTLPEVQSLPDPFVFADGTRVKSPEQWFSKRRPELKGLFQHYMYGTIPAKPAHMQAKVVGEYRDFLGGKATLKLVRLETGPANAPNIDLMLIVPNERRGPAPVFLAMD